MNKEDLIKLKEEIIALKKKEEESPVKAEVFDEDELSGNWPDGKTRYTALQFLAGDIDPFSKPYPIEEIEAAVDPDSAVKRFEYFVEGRINDMSLKGKDLSSISFGLGMFMFCETGAAKTLIQKHYEGEDLGELLNQSANITLPYAILSEGGRAHFETTDGKTDDDLDDEAYYDIVDKCFFDGTSVVNISDFIEAINSLGYEIEIAPCSEKSGDIALDEIKRGFVDGGDSFDFARVNINFTKKKTSNAQLQ